MSELIKAHIRIEVDLFLFYTPIQVLVSVVGELHLFGVFMCADFEQLELSETDPHTVGEVSLCLVRFYQPLFRVFVSALNVINSSEAEHCFVAFGVRFQHFCEKRKPLAHFEVRRNCEHLCL